MKNFKRRLLSSIALVLILILSATVLGGCYITNSGKMKKVEGTYELTTYSGDSDWLTERGMKLIMVIRSDGTGYYGYKDNNTKPFISELRCRFIQDPEEAGKYEYLEIDFEGNGEYYKLAINTQFLNSETNLNSQKPVWKGNLFEGTAQIDYHISVDFTRISKATDNSVLDDYFPGEHSVVTYGSQKYQGTYSLEEIDGIAESDVEGNIPVLPFVYFYLDIDFYTGMGRAYYMLKEDEEAKELDMNVEVRRNVDGSFTVYLGIIASSLLDENFSNYIHISYNGAKYIMRRVGDMTHEDIVIHCESAYSSYLAGLDVSEK